MIIGTGIFAASGAATAAAGSGILIAIVLGGTVALATGISAAQLGVNFPEEGGAFSWARAFDHDTTGFIAGCGYLGKALVSMSVVGLALTTYLAQAIPGLPQHIVAAVCVLVITGLNVNGAEVGARVVAGIRPERIVLHLQAPGERGNVLLARVSGVIYFGDHLRLLCSVGEGQAEATVKLPLSGGPAPQAGQDVWLEFPPELTRIYR